MAGIKLDRGSFNDKAQTLHTKLSKLQDIIGELPPGAETTSDVDRALVAVTHAWEELRDLIVLNRA